MSLIKNFFKVLSAHKLKILVMLLSVFVFAFLLFPFNDLSDFVSAKVAQTTGNNVSLQFENLELSLIPQAGLALEDVHVEAYGFPPLKAEKIVFSPALGSLILKKPAGSIVAKGFLKGQLEASLKPGPKLGEKAAESQSINISLKNSSLEEIRNLTRLPLALKGNLTFETEANVDLAFTEQPDATVSVKIQDFVIPPGNIATQLGPFAFSGIKLSNVDVKGRLSNGKIVLQEGTIGKDGDEIQGTIKGSLALSLNNMGGVVVPNLGAYSFDLQLTIKKSFQTREALLFQFLEKYKAPAGPNADRFSLRISGQDFQAPPMMDAVR